MKASYIPSEDTTVWINSQFQVFFQVSHGASTLAWRQATVLILVTTRSSLASCDDVGYQNFRNGHLCVTETPEIVTRAPPTKPRCETVMKISQYLVLAHEVKWSCKYHDILC